MTLCLRVIGLVGTLVLSACAAQAPTPTLEPPTPAPTNTPFVRPTLPPTFTPSSPASPTSDATLTPTPVLVQPLTGIRIPPPFTITLPEGWGRASDTFIYEELGDVVTVPFVLYQGPVTGGRGTILVLWNFRSAAAANPLGTPTTERFNWSDGLRLLRYPVFEPTCNIGTEPQRTFSVGGRPATGTNFAAVDCPGLPDTRGWFAGLTVNDVPFVFYVYADPLEAMANSVPWELQAILDSVVFQ
jgi:hypothetical protein